MAEHIEETAFLAEPAATLDRVTRRGETIEICRDGLTVALIIPSRAPIRRQAGGSGHMMRLTESADTLDDLLTDADAAAWSGRSAALDTAE